MDITTVRNSAIRQMLRGYTYAEGHTPDGLKFKVEVKFHDPARGLRGVSPEAPILKTKYIVSINGVKAITLENEAQVRALIVNNDWKVE